MANHAPMESNKGRPGPNFTKAGPVISKVRLKTRHQRRNARSECVQIRSRAIRGIKKNVNWQNRTPTRQRDTRGVRLSSGGSAAADFTLALASLLCYVSIHWSRIQYPRKIWNDFHPPCSFGSSSFLTSNYIAESRDEGSRKNDHRKSGIQEKSENDSSPVVFFNDYCAPFLKFLGFFWNLKFYFFLFFQQELVFFVMAL